MKKLFGASAVLGLLLTVSYTVATQQTPAASTSSPQTSGANPDLNGVVKQYCSGCHSDSENKSGNLSLAKFDIAKAFETADVSEKMIRKLRAGMMPPPGSRRPDAVVLTNLVETLEKTVDTGS